MDVLYLVSVLMEQFLAGNTPETQYSKPRYSKILDIVNKTQLPSWDFIEILCLDIVNDLI